ncbi:putative ABC transporter A, ABCA [Medicago truncatula]|uniref:Putative ABC transporter A, ABCA n=1 Tax=Medicago truncatula TaxID=3880 RepID=A0A396GIH3_MEDTR|nr:putative ABC transporter A, ABCA [Medicago truncatula]
MVQILGKLVILMVPSSAGSSTLVHVEKDVSAKGSELFTRDDSYVSKSKSTFYHNWFGFIIKIHNCQDGDKLSLIKLASIIEVSAKKGTRDLKLQGKLMDQVDWLPDSIGKLSSLILGIMVTAKVIKTSRFIADFFLLIKAVAMVKKTHAYKNKLRALELERSGGITNKKGQKNKDRYGIIMILYSPCISNAYLQFLRGFGTKILFEFVKEMPKSETPIRIEITTLLGSLFFTWVVLQLFPGIHFCIWNEVMRWSLNP